MEGAMLCLGKWVDLTRHHKKRSKRHYPDFLSLSWGAAHGERLEQLVRSPSALSSEREKWKVKELTLKYAPALQYIPWNKHGVKTLWEARSAGGFGRELSISPLGEKREYIVGETSRNMESIDSVASLTLKAEGKCFCLGSSYTGEIERLPWLPFHHWACECDLSAAGAFRWNKYTVVWQWISRQHNTFQIIRRERGLFDLTLSPLFIPVWK